MIRLPKPTMIENKSIPDNASEQQLAQQLAQILDVVLETRAEIKNQAASRGAWIAYFHLILGFCLLIIYVPQLLDSEIAYVSILVSSVSVVAIVQGLSTRPWIQRVRLSFYCFLAAAVISTLYFSPETDLLFAAIYFSMGANATALTFGLRLNAMLLQPDLPRESRKISIATILSYTALVALVLTVSTFLMRQGILNDIFNEASSFHAVAFLVLYGGVCGLNATAAWAFAGRNPSGLNQMTAIILLFTFQLLANLAFSSWFFLARQTVGKIEFTFENLLPHLSYTLIQIACLAASAAVLRCSGHIAAASPSAKTSDTPAEGNDDQVFA